MLSFIQNKITPLRTNFAAKYSFLTKKCAMTEDDILKALSNVQEPDLGKDLVTLNMVKDIVINGNNVSFTVVLTTPACPLKELIKNACINAVKILVNKEAEVSVNFTSNTSTNRKDNKTVLSGVRN